MKSSKFILLNTKSNQSILRAKFLVDLKNNSKVWSIQESIDLMKKQWDPLVKTEDGFKCKLSCFTEHRDDFLYWDVANAKWTTRTLAFKSYASEIISQLF